MVLTQRKSYARKPSAPRVRYVLSSFDDLNEAIEYLLKSRLGKQDREFIESRQAELLTLRASFENNLIARYHRKMTHFV